MIIYALIARLKDAAVLVETGLASSKNMGNIPQVSASVLQHLRDNPGVVGEGDRKTFEQKNEANVDFFSNFIEACQMAMGDEAGSGGDEFYFHFYRKKDVIYFCLADDAKLRDQKVAFAFLDHLEQEFTKRFRAGRINTANAYSLNKEFQPNLRSAMHYHNVHHEEVACDEKVQKIMSNVDSLKRVMGRNIALVLENQQKFEALIAKSDIMKEDAIIFKKKSNVLKVTTRNKAYCYSVMFFLLILTVTMLGLITFCGQGMQYCRVGHYRSNASSNSNSNNNATNNNNNYNNAQGGGGRM